MANTRCAQVSSAKEKSACVTGAFIDFCQIKKNKKFCKNEATRADHSNRMVGAKNKLKAIYKHMKKGGINLSKAFREDSKESFYYIFGVPEKCKLQLLKGEVTHSAKLHGLFERAKKVEERLIKKLNSLKCPKKSESRVYAVGQVDDDATLDIWYVDNKKRIRHLVSDLKR